MENPKSWKEEAELLMRTISELHNAYINTNRKAHLKDFEELEGKIAKAYKGRDSRNFCKLTAQEVERRYLERVDQWCGSKTIGLFKKNKTRASFVDEINENPNDHHYSRMLGLILSEMLTKESHVDFFEDHWKLEKANVSKINMPTSDAYAGLHRHHNKMPGPSSMPDTTNKKPDDPFAGFDEVRPGYNSRRSSK